MTSAVWDENNQRFVMELRCPFPECDEPVRGMETGLHGSRNRPVLGRCPGCGRTFDHVSLVASSGGMPAGWTRRPEATHCSFTGAPLVGYSPSNWAEAGGDPGRTHCIDDPTGAVFGEPDPRFHHELVPSWNCRSVHAQGGPDTDTVSSVSVYRGVVVAVTRRGYVAFLDLRTGNVEAWVDWPDGATDVHDPRRRVTKPPTIRGSSMLVTAPFCAYLHRFTKLPDPRVDRKSIRLSPRSDGHQFVGPALAVDGAEPLLCLLDAVVAHGLGDPALRFFTLEGEEVGLCRCEDIARPPVFDYVSNRVFWVDRAGGISSLDADRIRESLRGPNGDQAATSHLPEGFLELSPDDRATMLVAPDSVGGSELWIASDHQDTDVELLRVRTERLMAEGSWTWSRHHLGGGLGQLRGLAVGIGSRARANAAGRLVALATDRQVASFDKTMASTMPISIIRGPEGVGTTGSHDVPLLTSVGVLTRTVGRLTLSSTGTGWNQSHTQCDVPIEGRYDDEQGLALTEQWVFAGSTLGVRAFRIEKREAR